MFRRFYQATITDVEVLYLLFFRFFLLMKLNRFFYFSRRVQYQDLYDLCRYLNAEDYKGGFEQKEIEDILSVIGSNFTAWAKSFATLVMGVADPKPREKFCRSFLLMRPETALSVAKTIFLADWRDVLERVEVPCTIIQGTNDLAVPVSVAHYMQSRMKAKARVEIIEGDGHFPQLTSPKVLIGIIDGIFVPKNGRGL